MGRNMNKTKLRRLIAEVIQEFKEDMGKQCVVMMGLPGAGKSTFINNELAKYIPIASSYKVINSDTQLKAAQYETAKSQYNYLLTMKTGEDFDEAVDQELGYKPYQGEFLIHPVTWEWWEENKDKGLKHFWGTFYKSYYASYFDVRDFAKGNEKKLFADKIISAGKLLIIDTVASKSSKIFGRLEQTKKNEFFNTIIYLEINPKAAIARDEYRKKREGRSVGSGVINDYASKMSSAYKDYQKDGEKQDGVVDRILHFKWSGPPNPKLGKWVKKDDIRYNLKRRLKQKKGE